MKTGKYFFAWQKALFLGLQRVLNLLPLILGAMLAGYAFKIAFRHTLSFNLSNVRQQMAMFQKQWNIAKDPECRRDIMSSMNSTSTNNLMVYDYEEEKENLKPQVEIKEIWKEPGLLNLADFRWIMNNQSICKPDPNAPSGTRVLPVLIHSWRNHFSHRDAIRKSWGSIPIYKKWDVRLVFLLGEFVPQQGNVLVDNDEEENYNPDYSQTEDEQQVQKLEEEQEMHGDLVMGNFHENSRNLTYKHMMGYKWILNFCSEAQFVIKADEDKFVDIMKWLDWRSSDMEILERHTPEDELLDDEENQKKYVPDLYCNLFTGGTPLREEGSTYYASKEDWPEDIYCDYCSSWAYGITVDLMKKQYFVSTERKFFWIDDVYFGALLQLVKEKFEWNPIINDCFKTFTGRPEHYREICDANGDTHFDKKKEFGPVVTVEEGMLEKDMMCLWKKTLHDSDYDFDKK